MKGVWIPKDKDIVNLLSRLEKDRAAIINFNVAKQFSRYKQIRVARAKDHIYIGMDRRKGKSVIFMKKPIHRKGKGFLL